jgi:hypothetical protein
MKNTKSLLVALILLGNIAVSGIAFAADGVISEDVLSTGSYCHEKFSAIEGKSLASDDPVLKSAQAGDIIDYYGPCDGEKSGAGADVAFPTPLRNRIPARRGSNTHTVASPWASGETRGPFSFGLGRQPSAESGSPRPTDCSLS